MKKSLSFLRSASLSISDLCFPLICALFSSSLLAQTPSSASAEKKVDYLERIYFSGENKEKLNIGILIALQEMQQKAPTTALAKQVTFLIDVKDKANAADNACDVLDLLAVGIYDIDAVEAVQQGVRPPSDKAKAKSADATENLNKLSSASGSVSSSARSLEWSSYLLSGGNYGSFAAGAGRLANTAGTIGYVAGTAGQVGQTVKDVGSFFKKKDKPCDVPKKDVPLGEHAALPAVAGTNPPAQTNAMSTTVITIPGISSAALRALTDSVRGKADVQSAEKAYNETTSTITVMHSGSSDVLADWFEDKFANEYKVLNYGSGKINLALKQKK